MKEEKDEGNTKKKSRSGRIFQPKIPLYNPHLGSPFLVMGKECFTIVRMTRIDTRYIPCMFMTSSAHPLPTHTVKATLFHRLGTGHTFNAVNLTSYPIINTAIVTSQSFRDLPLTEQERALRYLCTLRSNTRKQFIMC